MSCCYGYPCYTLCCSPCYRTVRSCRTYNCCNPCSYRSLYTYRTRYNCRECCSSRATCTTRYYYPSCCNYSYSCCYPCC